MTTTAENASILALLPSVDELLNTETAKGLEIDAGRERLTRMSREAIAWLRSEIRELPGDNRPTRESLLREAGARLIQVWQRSRSSRLRRVINATGVVIHTNLGRAPLSDEARRALNDAAGYCNVEYDIRTGDRGRRGEQVESMLAELTGAESAIVVNNCAAAAYLVLSAFAAGREVIISRGELVEIGGEFRVPDVLARTGAVLREVGTTNRTKLADYEKAVNENTAMILKVHPSNYRIVGFIASPTLKELSALAKRKEVLLYEDAGSGALFDLSPSGLGDEPVIKDSIVDGADLVTFSGDKLLGGPQAGLIVGRREYIDHLRKDPLYRALRVSKLIYAALEATLRAYLRGTAENDVPALRMLAADESSIEQRCWLLIERSANPDLRIEMAEGNSAVGGGAAPLAYPRTVLMFLSHAQLRAGEVERKLREREVPVIARIVDNKVAIDLRTVSEADEPELIAALSSL